jgi:biphenyl-2,3-diol 1,2-dioxygenase
MKEELQLGYLMIEAADADALRSTFVNVLGMLPVSSKIGEAFRMDDWERRFIVMPASANRLSAMGLVAANDDVYQTLLDSLRSAGIDLRAGTLDECEVRSVRQFTAFTDPAGIPVELAVAPNKASGMGFLSDKVPGGFLTGTQGLGHVVALADDPAATISFYTSLLGFHVSDTVEEETPDGPVFATFMHCNKRHHTLAIGKRGPQAPPGKVLGHFMVQVNEIDAVGLAYDRALDAGMAIYRTIGRHPNDGMFSFYMRTTAGFDIEFGADALEITDDWQVVRHHQMSAWGHRRGQGFV